MKIEIQYDPYRMKTALRINGKDVNKDCEQYSRIYNYSKQNIPLQSWIDPILWGKEVWGGLLWEVLGNSNETDVEVHFTGRKIDFDDLKVALDAQSKPGVARNARKARRKNEYDVTVRFPEGMQHFVYDDAKVRKQVQRAYNRITSDTFKAILDDKDLSIERGSDLYTAYEELPQKYAEALNGEFRIVFSGMYSSGKSTIINAILGKAILPARDSSCTSKVFEIRHDSTVSFVKMCCVDKNKNIVVEGREYTEESLRKKFEEMFPSVDESVPPSIETVQIWTDMSSLYPDGRSQEMNLVIVDTPGTNAAIGKLHCEITEETIRAGKNEIVVITALATQDQCKDIQTLLDSIDESVTGGAYDQRFLFVLNRADECRFELNHDSWEQRLQTFHDKVINKKENGQERSIQNPRLFPTSALAAFEVRTDAKSITTSGKYYSIDYDSGKTFPAENKERYYFDEFCSTSQAIKDDIAGKISQLLSRDLKFSEKMREEILLHSGIISLEMAIREYIAKYAFPLKIKTLLETYETIFAEICQLYGAVVTSVAEAEKAFERVKGDRKANEVDEERTEQEQVRLTYVREKIQEKQKELELIQQSFEKEANEQTDAIKANMNGAIYDARAAAEKYPKAAGIRERIQKIVDSAAKECREQIENIHKDNFEKAAKIGEEINHFFLEIKDLVDLGENIDLSKSCNFAKAINGLTDSINDIKEAKRRYRYDDFRKRGRIRGFFEYLLHINKDTSDGISLENLGSTLVNIRRKFNTEVEDELTASKTTLSNAISKLTASLEAIQKAIEDSYEKLKTLQAVGKQIARDFGKHEEFVRKNHSYEEILGEIQKLTNFSGVDKE